MIQHCNKRLANRMSTTAKTSISGLLVSETGKLLIRNLAMAFDAYLPGQQSDDEGPKFSRTV